MAATDVKGILLAEAKQYLDYGRKVVTINGKKPTLVEWTPLRDVEISIEQVREWLSSPLAERIAVHEKAENRAQNLASDGADASDGVLTNSGEYSAGDDASGFTWAVGTRDQAQRFIEEVQRLHKERNSNGKSKLDSMINAKLSGNGIMESRPEEVNSSEGSTNTPEKANKLQLNNLINRTGFRCINIAFF